MCCLIMCYSLLEVRGSCPPATRSRNKIVQKKAWGSSTALSTTSASASIWASSTGSYQQQKLALITSPVSVHRVKWVRKTWSFWKSTSAKSSTVQSVWKRCGLWKSNCHVTRQFTTELPPSFSQVWCTVVRKRDNRQQTNNISLIYGLLTVFLRNRTKGPEIQIEDKDARHKKIPNLSAPDKRQWLQRQGNNSTKLWSLKIW